MARRRHSGRMRALAFRLYVDLTLELGRDMSTLLAETEDLYSDREDEVLPFGRWGPVPSLFRTLGVGWPNL